MALDEKVIPKECPELDSSEVGAIDMYRGKLARYKPYDELIVNNNSQSIPLKVRINQSKDNEFTVGAGGTLKFDTHKINSLWFKNIHSSDTLDAGDVVFHFIRKVDADSVARKINKLLPL